MIKLRERRKQKIKKQKNSKIQSKQENEKLFPELSG